MTRPVDTCAGCERFPREALEGDGVGFCSGYEREVRWNDRASVLHKPVGRGERDARRHLVTALMEQESNKPA